MTSFLSTSDIDAAELRESERTKLIADIRRFCLRPDFQQGKNILLVGRPGVGKSSIINTLVAAIVGEYLQKANVHDDNSSLKSVITRYPNCGVVPHDFVDESTALVWNDMTPLLPNIYELPVTSDENDQRLEEIFDLIIGGFIPPGTDVTYLLRLQEDHGTGSLPIIYNRNYPQHVIHKVVFVQSPFESVPRNLVQCLRSAVEKRKETCNEDVYLVVSKCDRLDTVENDTDHTGSEIEQKAARILGFHNNLKHNRMRFTSFSDSTGYNSSHIKNIALQFLRRMVTPELKNETIEITKLSMQTTIKLWLMKLGQNLDKLTVLVIAFLITYAVSLMANVFLQKKTP